MIAEQYSTRTQSLQAFDPRDFPLLSVKYYEYKGGKILFTSKTFVAEKRRHKYSLLTAGAKKLTCNVL
jgi:hypothetical protein